MSKEAVVAALRRHTDNAIKRQSAHGVVGVVQAIGSATGGLKVHIPVHDFLLDSDDLLVGQAVAQFDSDYGLKIGDSLALVPAANGDYMAVAVLTGTEPTARRWDGLLINGTGAPTGSDGRDLDFYIRTDADPNNWKIYGPKVSGSWPAGIPIRGPVGATGPAGIDGTAFRVGTGAPAAGLGVNGDSYFDKASGLLYAPKAGGAWPAGVQMISTKVIGEVSDWPGPARSVPALYLACFGQSVLRATYPALFAALCPQVGVFTVTLASPGVFSSAGHGLVVGDPVFVTTTGALPTGLAANTTNYVMTVPTSGTFTLGTTRVVTALTGTAVVTVAVNTSGAQSGVHTVFQAPNLVADATHFNIPDYRGMPGLGKDDMGGSAAGRLSWTKVSGIIGGEEAHTLLLTETPAHSHTVTDASVLTASGVSTWDIANAGGGRPSRLFQPVTDAQGGGLAHNNMPPGIVVVKMIYAGA